MNGGRSQVRATPRWLVAFRMATVLTFVGLLVAFIGVSIQPKLRQSDSASAGPVVTAIRVDDAAPWEPRDVTMDEMRQISLMIHSIAFDGAQSEPIPEIREPMEELAKALRSGEVSIMNRASYSVESPTSRHQGMMAGSSARDGDKTIVLFIAEFRDEAELVQQSAGIVQAARYVRDLVTIVLLHEAYHLLQQDISQVDPNDSDRIFAMELDCWDYTCRNVIDPLQRQRRGAVLTNGDQHTFWGYSLVYIAWKDNGCSKDSPEFQKAVRLQCASRG